MATAEREQSSWAGLALEKLHSAGFRRGGARRCVIELLDHQECALSAQEMEGLLEGSDRKVARASVYRVLEELESLGLVTRIEVGDGIARFESVLPHGEHHHHHMVCKNCGELVPFEDEELERVIHRLSDRLPFEIDDHDITLRGSCEGCECAKP